MAANFRDQSLYGMLVAGGSLVLICRWSSEDSEYDAQGWIDKFGSKLGGGLAPLPDGGVIDLSAFAYVQPKAHTP